MNRRSSASPLAARKSRKYRSRPVLRGEALESRALLDGGAASLLMHYLSSNGLPAYHNPSQAGDVTADAQVSLKDLVALSRDLHVNGPRNLAPPAGAGEDAAQAFFVDVNGDNRAAQ